MSAMEKQSKPIENSRTHQTAIRILLPFWHNIQAEMVQHNQNASKVINGILKEHYEGQTPVPTPIENVAIPELVGAISSFFDIFQKKVEIEGLTFSEKDIAVLEQIQAIALKWSE